MYHDCYHQALKFFPTHPQISAVLFVLYSGINRKVLIFSLDKLTQKCQNQLAGGRGVLIRTGGGGWKNLH